MCLLLIYRPIYYRNKEIFMVVGNVVLEIFDKVENFNIFSEKKPKKILIFEPASRVWLIFLSPGF